MTAAGLHRFAIALAICTLILVVAGAAVVGHRDTLNQSVHRVAGAVVGLLTLVVVAGLFDVGERKSVKILGVVSLLAVIVQGAVGARSLQVDLPKAVLIGHACLAHLFFAATVAIAITTSLAWHEPAARVEDGGWPSLRTMSMLAPLAVVVQIALGAAYRHQVFGVLAHMLWAMGVTLIVMMASIFTLAQCDGVPRLKRTAIWVLSFSLAQPVFGGLAYFVRPLALLHVGIGACVLGACVALALEIFRNVVTVRRAQESRSNLSPAGQ